jgi:DNA invertase Pin-like site-specific DNA recombinase
MGALLLNVLGSIAQFEREMMLERQRDGIAKAKAEGKYKGRKPTARAQADKVRSLAAEGLTRQAIADRLHIGIASVYRILREHRSSPHGLAPQAGTVGDDVVPERTL